MFRPEASVTTYVLFILLMVAVILLAALGTLDHLSERARREADLLQDARLNADQLAASLALPVWNFDLPQVEKILDGMIRDPEVYGVSLHIGDASSPGGLKTFTRFHNSDGAVLKDSALPPADSLVETRPIFAYPDQQTPIGNMQVLITRQFMQRDLWNQLLYRAITLFAFGLILAAILYWLLWRNVLKPLNVIEQYAGEVSSGAKGSSAAHPRFRGELARLRSSIEKMVALLATRYDSLLESEQRIAGQLRFEEVVAGISAALVAAESHNLDRILQQALADIAQLLRADRIVLGQTDDQTGAMLARATFRAGEPPFPDRLIISERYPALWRQLCAGEVSHIRDVRTLGPEAAVDRTHFAQIGIETQITTPVLVDGRLRFILAVASVGHRMLWTDEAVARIKFLGEVLATTVMRCAAEQESQAYSRRIHALATQLTHAEERQRRELAIVLHDEVGQNLFAATTQLLAIRAKDDQYRADIEKTLALLDQIARDTRELTFELCPPVLYQLGLAPALERLVEQFAARYAIECTFTGNATGPADLNSRGLAYQAVRELLANVAKHSHAQHVSVQLDPKDGTIQVCVIDDGQGFDPRSLDLAKGGFGLFQLRERIELFGGRLTIRSEPGQGCQVRFQLPLEMPVRG